MFDIRKIQEQILFEAVKKETNEETASAIVSHNDENNPLWVKNTMKRLEENFDGAKLKLIRMNCQCGYAMDEKFDLLNELLSSSSSMQEFASHPKAKAAGLSYHNGELYLQFSFCPCPMLAETDRLETNTWCQCTTGYSKVVFEKAFQCEVDVELLSSIKMGEPVCLMKIIPMGTVCFPKLQD